MSDLPTIYTFDNFRFDAQRLALYHNDILVKTGNTKTMQVLAVLLLNPNRLTTHEEIIEKVWHDNPHGITSDHVRQYTSKLRKLLAEFDSGKDYIETVKGRGYSFVGIVSTEDSDVSETVNAEISDGENSLSEDEASGKSFSTLVSRKTAFISIALILVLAGGFTGWSWFSSSNDEEEIRRVVKESQMFESLVLYKNPESFTEESLDPYWTTEIDINSNYDRRRIREAVQKLINEGRHYGDETKCEQFEFQTIEINQEGNLAVVKTLEKWFAAVYFDDGTLEKNKTIGPYFVSYILRKIDGNWLIEKSTTARVIRPTPRLSEISLISEPKAKQQFFVKITGQDFEPETVFLEVIGEGCPESNPCKVPNSALRENSKLSAITLDNIPLTLDSGNFKIALRNGDSQASNPLFIDVP